jgi:hypothetical protein
MGQGAPGIVDLVAAVDESRRRRSARPSDRGTMAAVLMGQKGTLATYICGCIANLV